MIASAVAKKVNGVVITSSPQPICRAIKDIISASVPELQPTANLVPQKLAKFSSNCCTTGPFTKRCESIIDSTTGFISCLIISC